MRKIILQVDEVSFKSKPFKEEIANIQNRLRNEDTIKEMTIEELFENIKKGYTFVPGVTRNGTKNENWEQQEVIFIDVDNDDKENVTTLNKTLSLLKEKNINPLGYYYTFGSTEEIPRFRIIFLLDEVIKEKEKMKNILKTLTTIIGGDEACKNVARIFFGTNGEKQDVVLLNPEATITQFDIDSLNKNNQVTISKEKNSSEVNELNKSIKEFDLLSYMKKDNTIDHTTDDIVYFKDCAICGHKDCLRYYQKSNTFCCFGKNGNKQGTIIDYLMATKNIDVNEAIKYFLFEILKVQLDIDEDKEKNLKIVQNQIRSLNFGKDFVNTDNFNWIYDNKVLCPLLAEFIRNKVKYIFVKNNAKEGVLRYYYFDNYYKLISDEDMKGIIKHFIPLHLQRIKNINETLNLLYTDISYIKMEDLNNENIINFKNGILHLDTKELKPHSPTYLSTIRIPCNYYENVPKPEKGYFDTFMNTLTNNNESIKKLLLQFIGVVISNVGGYRYKKALILYGKGNTGKSVLKNFLTRLIGRENSSNIDLRRMEEKFGIIQLLNKRLVGSNDMSYLKIKELEIFKQAVGGDSIYAEFKGENGISFTFNGVLWFCTNQLPKFGGDQGDWVYDRIVVVECKNVIPEEKQDKRLIEHLLEEKDYIVSLAIKELFNTIGNDYKYDIPESCKQLNEVYKIENNSFRTFLETCCIDRIGKKIEDTNCTKGKIHKVYQAWYKDTHRGLHYETAQEIRKLLESLGKYNVVTSNNGNEYYTDFTLKDTIKREYSHILGFSSSEPIDVPIPEMEIQGITDVDEELNF